MLLNNSQNVICINTCHSSIFTCNNNTMYESFGNLEEMHIWINKDRYVVRFLSCNFVTIVQYRNLKLVEILKD